MKARLVTQLHPASFESGFTERRLATIENITRSMSSASSRLPAATWKIALPIPRRSHSRSATHEVPIGRESRIFTSPLEEAVASTASAGSRKRLIERTRRASASLSTVSARPKLWMIFAFGVPVTGSRSLWASAR